TPRRHRRPPGRQAAVPPGAPPAPAGGLRPDGLVAGDVAVIALHALVDVLPPDVPGPGDTVGRQADRDGRRRPERGFAGEPGGDPRGLPRVLRDDIEAA